MAVSARSRVGVGTTYEGHDPALLERVLPLVDYLEITPDSIAVDSEEGPVLHGPSLAELKNVRGAVTLIVHGVGLSIGSHDGPSPRYLRLLDQIVEQLEVAWHSEHLAYTMVDGENLGTMLALPKTEAMLDLICERVEALQRRYGLPFLLENVVHVLPDYPGAYTDAAFLNALTTRSGCGLILDVYNLECDAQNQGFNIAAFLDELNIAPVRELHLACGVEHRGYLLDVHSRQMRDSTLALAQQVLAMPGATVRVALYELLAEAVPVLGHDTIAAELVRLREALA